MNQVYEEAFQAYSSATELLGQMLTAAATVEHQDSEFCQRELAKFDVMLQYSLLQIAVADGSLKGEELGFIYDIAKYGDYCKYLQAISNKPITWEVIYGTEESGLQELLAGTDEAMIDLGENFIRVFALLDMADKDTSYANLMIEYLEKIVFATMYSDGKPEEAELNNGCLVLSVFHNIAQIVANQQAEETQCASSTSKKSLKDYYVKKN